VGVKGQQRFYFKSMNFVLFLGCVIMMMMMNASSVSQWMHE